jgi:hypothetical protein
MCEWEGDRHFHGRGDTENPHEALLQPRVGMVANVAYTKTADMLAPVRSSPVLCSTAINQRIAMSSEHRIMLHDLEMAKLPTEIISPTISWFEHVHSSSALLHKLVQINGHHTLLILLPSF